MHYAFNFFLKQKNNLIKFGKGLKVYYLVSNAMPMSQTHLDVHLVAIFLSHNIVGLWFPNALRCSFLL